MRLLWRIEAGTRGGANEAEHSWLWIWAEPTCESFKTGTTSQPRSPEDTLPQVERRQITLTSSQASV